MTRLQQLRQDLEAIPSKRQRSVLVGRLSAYVQKTQDAVESFRYSADAETQALGILPDLANGSVDENRRKARRTATRLERRIRGDVSIIQQNRTDDDISNLVDFGRNAKKSIQNRWESHLTAKLQGYQTLMEAAAHARLSRSNSMSVALAYLRQRTGSPPIDAGTAQSIRESLDKLTDSIAELGLEGEAGDFIVAASKGEGSAQALSNPAVREFIDRHDLWRYLCVKFR